MGRAARSCSPRTLLPRPLGSLGQAEARGGSPVEVVGGWDPCRRRRPCCCRQCRQRRSPDGPRLAVVELARLRQSPSWPRWDPRERLPASARCLAGKRRELDATQYPRLVAGRYSAGVCSPGERAREISLVPAGGGIPRVVPGTKGGFFPVLAERPQLGLCPSSAKGHASLPMGKWLGLREHSGLDRRSRNRRAASTDAVEASSRSVPIVLLPRRLDLALDAMGRRTQSGSGSRRPALRWTHVVAADRRGSISCVLAGWLEGSHLSGGRGRSLRPLRRQRRWQSLRQSRGLRGRPRSSRVGIRPASGSPTRGFGRVVRPRQ